MMYILRTWATVFLAALAAAQQPSAATDPKDLATLSGITVSLAGQPLKKATLILRGAQAYTATSDAEGKFLFEGVQPGRYTLFADRQGFVRQTYGARHPNSMGSMLTLNKGENRKDLKFALTPTATISGKVLDDEGDPVAQASVNLMRFMVMNGKRRLMGTGGSNSDDNGDYKVTGLGPGRYFLMAAPQQRGMYPLGGTSQAAQAGKVEQALSAAYFPNAADAATATPIEITAGNSVNGMDIRLRKSQVVRVKGKVVGQQTARLRVMLQQSGETMMSPFGQSSTTPGKEGAFELIHVLPGSYVLLAANVEGPIQILARQPIEVSTQNLEGLVLNLQPPFEVHGTVQTVGEPVGEQKTGGNEVLGRPANTRINLIPTDMMFNSASGQVNQDGTFVLPNVVAGKYRLNINGTPPGTYVKAIRYGNADALASGLDLNDGGAGSIQVILSNGAGEITGSVQSDQGPVEGTQVTLAPDPPDPDRPALYQQSVVDMNGKFTIRNVAPGKYRVYAWEDLEPGAYQDAEFMKPLESLGTRVTVEENGKEQTRLTRISSATVDEARQKSGR